ncbi:GNAT family N-acetyltransferase [Cellvibrio fibrivorans]|uniref:RimJ/RimL family protein N-acetyltransferase n=1 Tax=Cellvibrio fibrivorans TaxID=126350 RepID=A0ABU1UT65_9GAMM|nr:GNAT family N-acetyltransferase [Cellvibrio fibrivorans]MDR7088333.1 RimJ/RimL family protein N-acetyltransferase [Cellvibrio fibrivorans]
MLELRKFEQKDEALLVSYLNDETQTHFLSARLPQPYTNEAAQWWVNTGSKIGVVYAIIHNGIFVGSISAIPGEFEKQKTAEIGYWVAKPYWGKGIASEALQKFTDFLFQNTDFIRLNASVFEGNLASANVLQKCGYKLEAVLEKAIYKNGMVFNEMLYSKICP